MERPRVLDQLHHLQTLTYGRRDGRQIERDENSDASGPASKIIGRFKIRRVFVRASWAYTNISRRWHLKPAAAFFLFILLAIPLLFVSGQQAGTTKLPVAVSSQQSTLTKLPLAVTDRQAVEEWSRTIYDGPPDPKVPG